MLGKKEINFNLDKNMEYDVIIIGSGPAGYTLACGTAKNGLKTLIIEKDRAGGVCLNVGCIPTKALINIVGNLYNLRSLNIFNENINPVIDRAKIAQKVKTIADNVSKGIDYLFKTNKVEFISGEAEIIDKNTVKVGDRAFKSSTIVIASGSRNKDISGFYKSNIDKTRIITSTEALFFTEEPTSITILGAGAIGVEFAYIFNNLGWQVNLLEFFPNILPNMDIECTKNLERSFKKKNINIITGARVTGITQINDELITDYETGNKAEAVKSNFILNALGRTPNSDIKGLDSLNIAMEKGFIKVDNEFKTSIDGVYAIGDVISNKPLLAHVAYAEARALSDILLKKENSFKVDYSLVPFCIYTEPQIASFGLTEEEAKNKNLNIKILKSFYKASGKAAALEKTEGFIKIIVDAYDETIIGAYITGYDATEIIHELLICAKLKIKIKDIADTMHAHPTIAELIQDTVKSFYGLNLH
jgi:dihydrolipoamide dehydrogenase